MSSSLMRQQREERARVSNVTRQLLNTQRAKDLIKEWDAERSRNAFEQAYGGDDEAKKPRGKNDSLRYHEPPMYDNMEQALMTLKSRGDAIKAEKAENQQAARLDLVDIVQLLRQTIALTVDGDEQNQPTLLTYDYDNNIYSYSPAILSEYIAQLTGSATQNMINSVTSSLIGYKRALAAPIKLPDYKIAVGNGIFNCLTGELEKPDPRFIVTEKIDTNYIKDAHFDSTSSVGKGYTFTKLCAELANFEADRIQLLQQICKAIVTGHSVADAFFIIVGKGGDGKSTFFQLMVNTVGQKNAAFVNFDELQADDKMAETINKKLVLGMDNNANTFIRKTALLKSIAAHEYITHSRKYERPKSVPFSGSFIQLCNELPRFSETGDSIRRRVVCFHAQNSHYKMGTEDKSLGTLINDKSFQEHVLSEILDESKCGFYSDYNDVDRSLIESSLDNEDVLAQFIDEMNSVGVFTSANDQIPTTHLFAAYRDWMKITSPNSSPLSALSFTQRVQKYMNMYGYEIDNDLSSIRPSSLIKANAYSPQLFEVYSEGYEFKEARDKNTGSRVFKRTHAPMESVTHRRGASRCSSLEFFNQFRVFLDWVKDHDSDMHEALSHPTEKYSLVLDELESPRKRIRNTAGHDDTSQEVQAAREQEKRNREFDESCKPPLDIRNSEERSIPNWDERYHDWLDKIRDVEPENVTQRVMRESALDQAASFMSQIAQMNKDAKLDQLAKSVRDASGAIAVKYAHEFVKTLAKSTS